jgi:uncharacterized protein
MTRQTHKENLSMKSCVVPLAAALLVVTTPYTLQASEKIIFHYPDGSIQAEHTLRDGKLDGMSRTVHANGTPLKEAAYVKGRLEGPTRWYYPDGSIRLEEQFVQGRREGISRLWYANGTLRAEFSFRGDRLDGISTVYAENGRVIAHGTYKNGLRDGITRTYYPDGTTLYHLDTYAEGRLIRRESFNPEGVPTSNSHGS